MCGGLVVFLPSYDYEAQVVERLTQTGCLEKLQRGRRVFREPKKAAHVDATLHEYAQAVRLAPSGCVLGHRPSKGPWTPFLPRTLGRLIERIRLRWQERRAAVRGGRKTQRGHQLQRRLGPLRRRRRPALRQQPLGRTQGALARPLQFYPVLPSFTGFYLELLGFYLVLLGFTNFYWVLPSFTRF